MRPGLPALAAWLATVAVGVARADVPPPGGETCTFEKVWAKDEACVECGGHHDDAQRCTTRFAGTDFVERCRTGGGTVWREIWCRPDPGNAGKKPACGCSGPGEASLGVLLVAGVARGRSRAGLRRRH